MRSGVESTEDRVLYARLLEAIADGGAFSEDAESIVITALDGRRLRAPMRLHVTPETFGRHLRAVAAGSAGAFPEVSPVEAAWRLFLVHLDETVQTAKPGETELVPVPSGLHSLRPDMTKAPLSEEQLANRDDQRRYDRLIDHFADRGEVELELEAQTIVIRSLDDRVLEPPVRLRVPFRVLADHLRAAADAEGAWRAVVAEMEAIIAAGGTDAELRANGSFHVRS
jgi:hypothetical protein